MLIFVFFIVGPAAIAIAPLVSRERDFPRGRGKRWDDLWNPPDRSYQDRAGFPNLFLGGARSELGLFL